ncbi:MAG: Gfo/Idh/MocA family oxidoreductase, partial [Phycisphaerae bacterium]
MESTIDRRDFLRLSTAATAGLALTSVGLARNNPGAAKRVRVGVVGTGNRGRSLLHTLLAMKDVEIPALCDIDLSALSLAQELVVKAERNKPEGYSESETVFEKLMDRDDLDAVIIATPWHWHTPMAVYCMKTGKYAGVEVPAAITMDECWELVNTHEQTGVPCMMLENWSFRRDNLAVLNIIRKGLMGEIVHCHCAHSHDCIDHWFFDAQGHDRWGAQYLLKYNRDQYPTHSLGPVLSWMDINCGDNFAYLTSTATASRGINAYFARKFGPDHPNARRKWAQGDIVTSVVRTRRGRTIVINYDMQLPRPYDNRWMIQGTLGVYNEQRAAIYLTERSPKYHQWEPFAPYQEEFEHTWWKALKQKPGEFGHGGTDHLELQQFLRAVRNKT